jgi:hypothetical protein
MKFSFIFGNICLNVAKPDLFGFAETEVNVTGSGDV